MRKLLISLLLASAAASPALADPNDPSDRQARSEARSEARAERQRAREDARVVRSSERASFTASERADRPVRDERVDRQADVQRQAAERPARSGFNGDVDALRAQRVEQRQGRIEQIRDARELRQSARPLPNVLRTRTPIVSREPRPGTQPPLRAESRPSSQPTWSTSWRHDNRYDWHNWRKRHHSLFRLGFYYDPFGWSYSPYQIGWRLWPSYYGSRYWINDPWQYRLPYAPPGYRWIRYWDDAYLVDTWSGEVVDVIYNFFW